ncbi:nuclear transport factor 2 family protein [Rhodococcus sp. USK10]|uniref:ester cyclase n=1 Tax=Rhodococcus sp. USK10 TaxID=2789739 RepID=UPI001C5E7E30|nr:nuclear transport factor 2 family protein [Rhodococcus sp. USK10]QYB05619.1 nuclear transport factor 2 family protein [Rhodococcus sp. USK10]
MSHQHGVHAVENFWARVWQSPQDPHAIDELVIDDFVIVSGGDTIRGRADFKEWVLKFQSTVEDLEFIPVETFQNEDGSRVASLWEMTGRNRGFMGTEPDGQPIHLIGTAVWNVRADGMLESNRVERNAWELHRRLTA